jgi:hypothetical protein
MSEMKFELGCKVCKGNLSVEPGILAPDGGNSDCKQKQSEKERERERQTDRQTDRDKETERGKRRERTIFIFQEH